MCMIVLIGIRNILWPKKPPKDGKIVQKRLSSFLDVQLLLAPSRGRGSYLRRFVEHAQKLTQSYWPGLFHCYDDPRIPQTSNVIEGLFGFGKRILRKCGGRKSTANGCGSAGGSFFLFTAALHAFIPRKNREELLSTYSPKDYWNARQKQAQIRAPESKRRQYARAPDTYLERISQKWEKTQI
jgi:hypothetical protein